MSEPTIDELLEWLDVMTADVMGQDYRLAIRAILEQHEAIRTKLMLLETAKNFQESTAIRAFVERVERRLPDYDTGRGADAMLKGYRQAVYAELAALGEGG